MFILYCTTYPKQIAPDKLITIIDKKQNNYPQIFLKNLPRYSCLITL